MEELISVIVPVYNAADSLERTVKSITEQTYRNLEILLIDDGSTDESGAILKELSAKDRRIVIVHQENQGVWAARNKGLDLARGESIAFVDADDTIEADYFEVLLDKLREARADIVCCNWAEEAEEGTPSDCLNRLKKIENDRRLAEKEVYFSEFLDRNEGYIYVVWGKLFRRYYVEQCRFDKLSFAEDTSFMLHVFSKAPTAVLTTYEGYHYYRGSNSTTVKGGALNTRSVLDGLSVFHYLYKESRTGMTHAMSEGAERRYAHEVYGALSVFLRNGSYAEYAVHRAELKEFAVRTRKLIHADKKEKLLLLLYCLSERLYWITVGGMLRGKYKMPYRKEV